MSIWVSCGARPKFLGRCFNSHDGFDFLAVSDSSQQLKFPPQLTYLFNSAELIGCAPVNAYCNTMPSITSILFANKWDNGEIRFVRSFEFWALNWSYIWKGTELQLLNGHPYLPSDSTGAITEVLFPQPCINCLIFFFDVPNMQLQKTVGSVAMHCSFSKKEYNIVFDSGVFRSLPWSVFYSVLIDHWSLCCH